MKKRLYRILAGAIVIGAGYAAFLTASDGDFRAEFPFGVLSLVVGFLVIIPTFTAYAIWGENAGNRVLIPLLNLLHLPDALLERVAERYIVLPSEFKRPRNNDDRQAATSEPQTSENSSSGSISGRSDTA